MKLHSINKHLYNWDWLKTWLFPDVQFKYHNTNFNAQEVPKQGVKVGGGCKSIEVTEWNNIVKCQQTTSD